MVVITLLNTQDAMPTIGLGYLASYYMKYGKNNKKVKFDGRPSEEDIREAAIKNNCPIFNQTI